MNEEFNNGTIVERNGGFYYEKDGVVAGAYASAEVIKSKFAKVKKAIPKNIKTKPVEEFSDGESK